MPRPGPRRPVVGIRLGDDERARIEKRAETDGVRLSEMIRRLLAYGLESMPPGWNGSAPGRAAACDHAYPDVKNVAGVRVCRKCG